MENNGKEKKMNKKLIITVGMAVLAAGVFAGPRRGGRGPGFHHHGGPRFAPRHHHHHHHRHHSFWGRGGRHFWPGFAGGVVGGIVARSLTYPYVNSTTVISTPTVVTTPAVVTAPVVVNPTVVTPAPVTTVQNVWVAGRYVDQVQGDGTVVRVWQPGHYEQRTVVVP